MVGPGGKTGRKGNKAHFLFVSVFSLCAFLRACFCSLSLACGAVAVISYRGQPSASEAARRSRTADGQSQVAGGRRLQPLPQELQARRGASKLSKDYFVLDCKAGSSGAIH